MERQLLFLLVGRDAMVIVGSSRLIMSPLFYLQNFELAISPDSLVDICVRYYHPVEVLAMHRSTYKPRSIPPKALGDVNPAGLSRPKEVSSSVETLVSSPTDAKSFSDISGDSEMETIDLNSAIKDAEAAIRHSNRTSAVLSDVVPMRGNGHSDTLPPLPASQTGSRAAVNGSTGKGMERTLPRAMSSQATMGSSGSDRGLASSVGCYSTDRLDTLSASELHVNIGQRTAFRPKTHGILNASIDSIDLIELGPAPPAPSQTSNESAPKSSFRRSIWSVLRA